MIRKITFGRGCMYELGLFLQQLSLIGEERLAKILILKFLLGINKEFMFCFKNSLYTGIKHSIEKFFTLKHQ